MQSAGQTDLDPARPHLSLWDTASIIVGIVIGAGIYETAPLIFSNVAGPWSALGVWALGGVLSLIGALCYAELATTYPRSGGDYTYLSRAYGAWAGFLCGAAFALDYAGAIPAAVLALYEDFCVLNAELKRIMTAWQLKGDAVSHALDGTRQRLEAAF